MMQMQVLLNAVPNEVGVQNSILPNGGKNGGLEGETGSSTFQEKLGEKLKDCEPPVEQVPSEEQQVVQPMLKEDGGAEKSSQQQAIAGGEVVSNTKSDKQADKTPVAQKTTEASGKEKPTPEHTQTGPDRSTPHLDQKLNAGQVPKAAAKDAPRISSETVNAQKQGKTVETIVPAEAKTTTVANTQTVTSGKVVNAKTVIAAEAKTTQQVEVKTAQQSDAKTATVANTGSSTSLPLEGDVKLKQVNAGKVPSFAQNQAETTKPVASDVREARIQTQPQQMGSNVISIASKGSANLVNQEMSPAQQKMQMLSSMDRSANPIGMTFESGFQKSSADEPIVTFKQQQQSLFATSLNEPRFYRQNIMESANVQATNADKQMGDRKKSTKSDASSDKARPGEVREVKQSDSATQNSVNASQSSKPANAARAVQQNPIFSDNPQTTMGGEKDPGFASVMQKSETQFVMPETTTQARQSFVQNQTARILEQTQSQLLKQAKLGGGKVNMTLHPQSLGKLDVEIQIQSGTMKAFLVAEDPAVKEVLMQQQSQLKSALESQGLKLEEFSVSVREDKNQFSGGDSRQAGERRNGNSAGQSNGNEAEESLSEPRSVRQGNQNSLLDLIA